MYHRNKPISHYGMTMAQLPKRFIDATKDYEHHKKEIVSEIQQAMREKKWSTIQ